MNEVWKIGQVVKLVGSETPMTIENVREDGIVDCIWFTNDDHVQRDSFFPQTVSLWRVERSN